MAMPTWDSTQWNLQSDPLMDAFLSGAGGARVSNNTLLIPQPDGTYMAQFADETGQPGMGWTATIGADGQMIGEPRMAPIYEGSGINSAMRSAFGGPQALLAPLAAWGVGSALGLGEGAAALGGSGGSVTAAAGANTASQLAAADLALGGAGGTAGAESLAAALAQAGVPASSVGGIVQQVQSVVGSGGSLAGALTSVLGGQGLGAIAGGVLGALESANAPDSETVERRPYIDPRVNQSLMGDGTNPGYLSNLMDMATQAPPAGVTAAGGAASGFLSDNYANNLAGMQNAITGQMGSNIAAPTMQASQSAGTALNPFTSANAAQIGQTPTVQAGQINFGALPMASGASAQGASAQAQQMQAAQLRDPSQQGTNLNPAFNDYIYGDQGANPYLQGALQRGADQSRFNFQNMLDDQNQAFRENVLGNIRSGAIQAGGIGGSRQGIAEGIAARELAKQQLRAATQYGQDLNSAMIGAQSENFQQGRQLGAGLTGTLSGQQYGQNQFGANLQQDAGRTNAQLGTQASIASAGNQTSANIASAGNQTQAGVAGMNAMAGLLGQQAGLDTTANNATAGYNMQGLLANNAAANTANLANAQGANAYNLAGAQLGQNNQQFNATLGQGAATNNLQSQLSTNTLNQNVIQQGIGNMGNLNTGAFNTATQAQYMPFNTMVTGLGAYQPYASMYSSGSNTTAPLYNNPYASILGGALTGAQIGGLLR